MGKLNDRKDSKGHPSEKKGRENVDINTEFLQYKKCPTLLSTLKQSMEIINALQRQSPINNPVQQTKPHLQYKQNSNGIKKRVGVEITELEPCILCKGSHGLYNCPKIDDVKI